MNDLEIKGMKLDIAINCKKRREGDLSCEDCAIGSVCPRGRKRPHQGLCEDWEEETVIRAYKLLEE